MTPSPGGKARKLADMPGSNDTPDTPRTSRRRPWRRPQPDPGVPHHTPSPDQPRAGQAARVPHRPPPRLGAAPRGSRSAGRDLQRVLHPARARQRHRHLRERHRRHRPRAAARRGRAQAPARPAPHSKHDTPATPSAGPTARPTHRAARASTRCTAPRRSCSAAAWTSWPPTTSAGRCTHPSTPTRSAHPTTPGSSSSTHRRPSSSATGTRPPTTPSPFCAPKPAATPTTARPRT